MAEIRQEPQSRALRDLDLSGWQHPSRRDANTDLTSKRSAHVLEPLSTKRHIEGLGEATEIAGLELSLPTHPPIWRAVLWCMLHLSGIDLNVAP